MTIKTALDIYQDGLGADPAKGHCTKAQGRFTWSFKPIATTTHSTTDGGSGNINSRGAAASQSNPSTAEPVTSTSRSRSSTESALTIFRKSPGVRKNSLMLKMKRISLQTFFMPHTPPPLPPAPPLVVAAATASSDDAAQANADASSPSGTHNNATSDNMPAVTVASSTSISTMLGEQQPPSAAGGPSTTTSSAVDSNVTVANSLPSRSSPPPSFLLDEDPFANLGGNGIQGRSLSSSWSSSSSSGVGCSVGSGITIPHHQRPSVPNPLLPPLAIIPRPKSRLQEAMELDVVGGRRPKSQNPDKQKRKRAKTFFAMSLSAPVSPSRGPFSSKSITTDTSPGPVPPVPPLSPSSSNSPLPSSPTLSPVPGRVPTPNSFPAGRQPRPAHQRPAFAARPSLPSLDTLARMNVVLTKKVRKGHVGARLPFEPWDNLLSDEDCHQATSSSTATSGSQIHPEFPRDGVPPRLSLDQTRPHYSSFSVPTSPVRSSRSFASSSPVPQPLLPSQVVALGSLVEQLEMDLPMSRWTPPSSPTSLHQPDVSNLPSLPLSSTLTAAPGELDAPTIAPALLPSVPEDSEIPLSKVYEPEPELIRPISPANEFDESSYFAGDLLDDYGISLTSGDELLDHPPPAWAAATPAAANPHAQLASIHGFQQERGPANLVDSLQMNLRWSVETDECTDDAQPHSPTRSPSDTFPNSCAESFSDLFTIPSCPPFSYAYYTTSDVDSNTTDVSREFSHSRSISSTSSSLDEEVHSSSGSNNNIDLGRSCCNASQSSSSTRSITDGSLSTYEQAPQPRLSNDSLLPSPPDLEWESSEGGLSIQPEPAEVEPLQTAQIETGILIATDAPTLRVYENDDGEKINDNNDTIHANNAVASDAQSSAGSDANGLNWTAPANELFLTPSTTASFSSLNTLPLPLDEPVDTSTTKAADIVPNDRTSLLLLLGEAPSFANDTAPSPRTSPPPSVSREQLQEDENQDIIMINHGTRIRAGHVGGFNNGRPSFDRDRLPLSSSSSSSREVKQNVFGPGKNVVGYIRNNNNNAEQRGTADVVPLSSRSRSQSRSVSRSTSSSASKLPPLPPPPAPPKKQPFPSSTFTSSTETSDEDEDEEDDHDHDEDSASSDDDIPLARRIPGALTAQQVIRRQVKEERRAAREKRHRERQLTLRPSGSTTTVVDSSATFTPPSTNMIINNSTPDLGPLIPQRRIPSMRRPRTNTLPSKHAALEFGHAFNADDLTRKLQTVKMMAETPVLARQPPPPPQQHHHHHVPPPPLSHANSLRRSESRSKLRHDQERSAPPPRSFGASPSASSSAPLVRSLTSKRSLRAVDKEYRSQAVDQRPMPRRSVSTSTRGDKDGHRHLLQDGPAPPLPTTATNITTTTTTTGSGRVSIDDHRERGRRVLVKPQGDLRIITTTSPEVVDRHRERPIDAALGGGTPAKERVFVHSVQHYHMVDIGPTTTAGDLIASCEADGTLDNWAGLGGWMIWEIAQDFGMERPVRSYELLSEVQASWLKGKTVNYFLLKKTLLSESLGRSAIPSSAPMHSGWVEWESKRGKWNKRWMHLKENVVYLSKKEGRDETLLCSLSNFDAYYVTRSQRAPKPFVFTTKSTDSLSFFENTDDYMHTFSCSTKDGEAWVKKILIARSYVLQQERQALFNPKPTTNPAGGGASITRSGTRKSAASKQTQQQPLVSLAAAGVFEPGSLLSKQHENHPQA